MKALIIAAGNGTRMQPVTHGRHKSLMRLLGLKIIERVILGAKQAGIYEFVIVTGYRGADLRSTIGDGSKYGVKVTYVQNDEWHKANGLSVLKARKYLSENFVLLMSDHVFDSKTLQKIQRIKLKEKECVLAIDKNLDRVLDVEDTTKVVARNGWVSALNKRLESYSAFDTGMFVCSPYIFEVLKRTTGRGKNSLSDGMRVLVGEGKLRAFDIKGRFWSDCDTFEDIKFAEKKLLGSLFKSEDGIISREFNRRVSTLVSKFLIKTPISPNLISYLIPILAIPTFFLLATGVYPWILAGGILIQLMSILDGCDGEIARLKFLKSKWGGFLDANLDKYVDTLAVSGMTLGYLATGGNFWIVPLSLFLIFGLGLDGYMPNKFQVMTKRRLSFYKFKFINVRRDLRLLILAVGAVLNQVLFAFLLLSVIYHLKVAIRLASAKKVDEILEQEKAIARFKKTRTIAGIISLARSTKSENVVQTQPEKISTPFHFES